MTTKSYTISQFNYYETSLSFSQWRIILMRVPSNTFKITINFNEMKNKSKYFATAFKIKFQTIGILLLLLLLFEKVQSQKKFEFGMNVNSGFYFAEKPVLSYKIENGLQFGVGSQLYYIINPKTKIGLGVKIGRAHV